MKKVGLYFGTFNPVHVGHLIIANYFANNTDLNEVWFVISPQNPFKEKQSLLEDHHRLAMVQRAVEDNPKLKASNIEFDLPKPSYTVFTLQILRERHKDKEFCLIMGEDNLHTLHKWKNCDYIMENFEIYVYPRVRASAGDEKDTNDFADRSNVHIHRGAPIMNLNATHIRELIKNKKDFRYLLTEPVYKYVDEMNFYR
jgi:nicotinate-nucleotide adenylyltransferase